MNRKMCFVFMILIVLVQSASASVLWNGDFDTGDTSQYYIFNSCTGSQYGFPTSPVRDADSSHSAYFTILNGASLCNSPTRQRMMAGVRNSAVQGVTEGTTRYYAFSIYVPSGFQTQAGKDNLFWEIMGNYPSYPNIAMYTDGVNYNKFYFATRTGVRLSTSTFQSKFFIDMTKDVWHDFVVGITWSKSNTNGKLYLYHKLASQSNYVNTYSQNIGLLQTESDLVTIVPIDEYDIGDYRSVQTVTQTVYFDDVIIGDNFIDVAKGAAIDQPDPYVTAYNNSKTGTSTGTFTLNISESVTFNIISVNQTLTTKTWTPTAPQSNSFTTSWSSVGTKTVTFVGSNGNGSTQTITWTVTVQNATTTTSNLHIYGIGGNAITQGTNANRSHTTSNLGDGSETVGLFADNCNGNSSTWTWVCNNGVLTSISTRTNTIQNIANGYSNVSLFLKVNESTLNLWEVGLRYNTSRAAESGYQFGRPASTGLFQQWSNGTVWTILNQIGTGIRPTGTPYYAIFDINGSTLKSYISPSAFSLSLLNQTSTDSNYLYGNKIKLDGSNITFDDIRLINSGATMGIVNIWDESEPGNTTTAIRFINFNAPAGTSYDLEWRRKFSSDPWVVLGQGFAGNLTYYITNNQNGTNEVRVTLHGTGTEFPSFSSVEFIQGAMNSSSSQPLSGVYTFCQSGCNSTFPLLSNTSIDGSGNVYVSTLPVISNWKMNENTGTTTADENSTSNNDLTLVNTPGWSVGKYGISSLTFGGGSYGYAPSTSTLNMASNHSITGWIYPTASAWGSIIAKGDTNTGSCTDYNYIVEMDDSRRIVYGYGNGTACSYVYTSSAVSLNTWSHFAVKFNSTSDIKIYINGVNQTLITTYKNPAITLTPNTHELFVGVMDVGWDNFTGRIDDLRLYNYSLSASEIGSIMNNSEISSGDVFTWLNTSQFGSGLETYQIQIESVGNYHINYTDNTSISYSNLTGNISNNQLISISPRYKDTRFNLTLYSGYISRISLYWQNVTTDSILAIPSPPTNLTSTQGYLASGGADEGYWHQYTWTVNNTPNITDSYNIWVSSLGQWENRTVPQYKLDVMQPHQWLNITVYSYNNSGGQSPTGLSGTAQIENDIPTLSGIDDIYYTCEGCSLLINASATDLDDDNITVTISGFTVNKITNQTFNMSISYVDGDEGNHSYLMWITDGFGSNQSREFLVNVAKSNPIVNLAPINSTHSESESPPAIYYIRVDTNYSNVDNITIVWNGTVYYSNYSVWFSPYNVSDNTNHTLSVRGLNSSIGEYTAWSNGSINISEAPWQVSGLSLVKTTYITADIVWDNSSINDSDVSSYEGFINGNHAFYTTNTYYNLTGLAIGTSYDITVRANDTSNNWGANSSTLEITTNITTADWAGLEDHVVIDVASWLAMIGVAILISIVSIIFIFVKNDGFDIENIHAIAVAGVVIMILIVIFGIIPVIGYNLDTAFDNMVR